MVGRELLLRRLLLRHSHVGELLSDCLRLSGGHGTEKDGKNVFEESELSGFFCVYLLTWEEL